MELEQRQLQRDGLAFESHVATDEVLLREALARFKPNVVLCDYSLPGFSGRAALRVVRELAPDVPFIFVSGTIGEETAVECLRDGAVDYVLKGNPQRLGPAVRRALREVEERRTYEARIRHLANFDALTDLPNRALLGDRVEQALVIARRARRGLTLLTVSLDGLQLINEAFGHGVGDEALRLAAKRLTADVRAGDTVARNGSNEFTVLLPDTDRPEDIHGYARRLLDTIKAPHIVDGRELLITASAGAAIFPADGEDVATLMGNASAAARQAKRAGRDMFQFCSPDTMRNAVDRILLEAALSQAADRGILELHYQTQHDLATGRIRGMETLLRWQRSDGSWVPPATFIRVAEETGIIRAIGERTLELACQTAAPWIARLGRGARLGVNVSPIQLQGGEFARVVERVLARTGFPAECLELEVTEGAMMSAESGGVEAITALKALGAHVAIDDFGTGYSSFSYLSRLPIDRLKIDASFVANMARGSRDAAIVQSIVTLGHGLGLDVIAEGVETAEEGAALLAMGCNQGQGYHFSRPMTAEAVARFIEQEEERAGPRT